MSSQGTVPAWVIEKQQKQIALKREAERKKQVRQQITKVATAVRSQMSSLNNEDVNTWAKEEIEFVQHAVDSTSSIAEADVDFVLKRLHKSKPSLNRFNPLRRTESVNISEKLRSNKQPTTLPLNP